MFESGSSLKFWFCGSGGSGVNRSSVTHLLCLDWRRRSYRCCQTVSRHCHLAASRTETQTRVSSAAPPGDWTWHFSTHLFYACGQSVRSPLTSSAEANMAVSFFFIFFFLEPEKHQQNIKTRCCSSFHTVSFIKPTQRSAEVELLRGLPLHLQDWRNFLLILIWMETLKGFQALNSLQTSSKL